VDEHVWYSGSNCTIVWCNWTNDSTCNTTTTGTTVWRTWASDYTQPTIDRIPEATPEQVAQIVAAAELHKASEAKAEELLQSLLNEKQKEQWSRDKRLVIHGEKYKFDIGADNIVHVRSKDGEMHSFCCHAPTIFPAGDRVAAALLEILTDEEVIFRKGNRTRANDVADAARRMAA